MKTDTIPELSPAIVHYACQAFTISCEQHSVTVPISQVGSQPLEDVDGLNLQLFWWTKSPDKHLAEGRFYPKKDGGEILICFLHSKHGARVHLIPNRRDLFVGREHDLPRLITPVPMA